MSLKRGVWSLSSDRRLSVWSVSVTAGQMAAICLDEAIKGEADKAGQIRGSDDISEILFVLLSPVPWHRRPAPQSPTGDAELPVRPWLWQKYLNPHVYAAKGGGGGIKIELERERRGGGFGDGKKKKSRISFCCSLSQKKKNTPQVPHSGMPQIPNPDTSLDTWR